MANRFLKSIVVGVVGALGASVLALLAGFAFAAFQLWWLTRGTEAAGIGAVSIAIPGLRTVIAAPVGFLIGFYWRFRRGIARSVKGHD